MKAIYGVLIIAAMAASGCKVSSDENTPAGKPDDASVITEVDVITLKKSDFPRQLLSNGKLKAARRTQLYFEVAGSISSLNVKNNDIVQEGSTIAQLHRPDLQLALESAEISLRKAELELYDILAGQGYSIQDTSAIPDEILSMAEMRSGVAAEKNRLASAELEISGTILKAPFRGKIADLSLNTHDRVTSDPFCTVIDDSYFDVVFYVMESEYSFLRKGLDVRVFPFSDSTSPVSGYISEINPSVNENGQIRVHASVPNNGSLIDGMNVKVIMESKIPDQLVVPRSAIVVRDNHNVLFTCTEDGTAHWIYINIIESNGDSHAITADESRGAVLQEGDMVITSGNLNISDGSRVKIKH